MMIGQLRKLIFSILGLVLLSSLATRSSAAPLAVPPYPTYVAVQMYQLTENGTALPDKPCDAGNRKYGCTIYCNNPDWDVCDHTWSFGYPYAGSTAYPVIETYYLLDVVSQEMNPLQFGEPIALHAQAIAARSFLGWYLNNAPGGYDNSNGRQVFIPYKFDSLNPAAIPLEPNTTNPCASGSLNNPQRLVCNAIASRYYLARADNNPNNYPAFAEFTADVEAATHDHPEMWRFPYLKGVADPISAACDSIDFGANLAGMSQKGANRWARGHECSRPGVTPAPGNDPGEAWGLQWDRVEQVLFHYYTGVHLRDATGGQVGSGYRWNPLSLSMSGACPPYMYHGQTCTLTIEVQNTGVSDWDCDALHRFLVGRVVGSVGRAGHAPRCPRDPFCECVWVGQGRVGRVCADGWSSPWPGCGPAYLAHRHSLGRWA
jgi:hypothetical protein